MKKGHSFAFAIFIAGIITIFSTHIVYAQVFPANFSQVQYTGITDPVAMAALPDGRMLIVEQAGNIKVFKDENILPTPAYTINVDHSGERGLIGITADPDFASNGFIYVSYTVIANPSYNMVSSFTMSGDMVVQGSETQLLRLNDLSDQTIHNGGALNFGLDGKLYISVGDNANGINYLNTGSGLNPQDLTNYFGKLLRINKDGTIPSDNPYIDNPSPVAKRIWVNGLRNPYTTAVNPSNGKLFINDVGQDSWEEINDGSQGGKNFGWPFAEGLSNNSAYTNPLYNYENVGHFADGVGCAITGGTFFNPVSSNYPSQYFGKYFYMDHCKSWINYIDYTTSPVQNFSFASGLEDAIIYVTTASDGNLYYISRATNSLYKILYSGNTPPLVTKQPENTTVSAQQKATFTVFASGATPLSYQWYKNGNIINGANSSVFTINAVVASDAGVYSCKIWNSLGSVTSSGANLVVNPFNNKPKAIINTPSASLTYNFGDVISFSGGATDVEDGVLPNANLSWLIRFEHNHTHYHPVNSFDNVSDGKFIADFPETDSDVFYRIMLLARDSKGLTDTTYTGVFPNTSTCKLFTFPAGLQLAADGNASDNIVKTFVSNSIHSLQAISPQVLGNNVYEFERWTKVGVDFNSVTIPQNTLVDTAFFRPAVFAPGLTYNYYEGSWAIVPNFTTITPIKNGIIAGFDISPRLADDNFAFQYTGFIDISTDGNYTFYTTSDDGSLLYIDGVLVVDNNGQHSPQEKSGTVALSAGKHAIKVEFFEATGGQTLSVMYSGPNLIKQGIPSAKLFHVESATSQIFQTNQMPIIDGIVDPMWSEIEAKRLNTIPTGLVSSLADLSAIYKATWDATNLYLLVDVTDDQLVNESVSVFDDDAIEVFIDADNSKKKSYDGVNDLQYAFGWNDASFSEIKLNKTVGVSFAQTNKTGGYVMEIKFPWSTLGVVPTGGGFVGFDIQVDDDDNGGLRDKTIAWWATSNDNWQNPSNFGTLILNTDLITVPAANCSASGTILHETWSNINGTAVSNIPVNIVPSFTDQLSLFETPVNIADNYGTRVRGYVCVPTSGTYVFWVSGDDNAELWLSTDDNATNKTKIAYHNGWTNSREWDKYPSQQSNPISLVAGKKYYIEALMKEASGGDNLAVGWQLPDGTLERPILGNRLSPFVDGTVVNPPVLGDGLAATYYDNMDFTGATVSRIDTTVNFDWQNGSPIPSMGSDEFSIQWIGQVKANFSEQYTFYTNSDDGVRLWINDQLIIDNWTNHAHIENSGAVSLTANQKYNIKMEYFENSGGALANLSWSSASQVKEIIPKNNLYSTPSIPRIDKDILFLISPNPANEKLNIRYNVENAQTLKVSILNELGQYVTVEKYAVEKGFNNFELNTSDLLSGLYLILIDGDFIKTHKKVQIYK